MGGSNKWSCLNIEALHLSFFANTSHPFWLPIFETSLLPVLDLLKLVSSNDPQPLPVRKTARYPTLSNPLEFPLNPKPQ